MRAAAPTATRTSSATRPALNGDSLAGLWAAAAAAVAVGDVGSRSSESERQGSVDTSDTVCLACDEAEVLLERVRMMRPPPGVVASLAGGGRSYLPAAMLGRQSTAVGSQAPLSDHNTVVPADVNGVSAQITSRPRAALRGFAAPSLFREGGIQAAQLDNDASQLRTHPSRQHGVNLGLWQPSANKAHEPLRAAAKRELRKPLASS